KAPDPDPFSHGVGLSMNPPMAGSRRVLGSVLGALVVASGLTLGAAVPAGAATSVSTEAQLRTALADGTTTEIALANDIDLTDCTAGGGDLDRAGALALDGAGFTIRQ